ncbi:MAG: discoidin domain-containing protein, partial [Planctomycetota bacterium]
RNVAGLRYTPRQDADNGRFARYRIEVSEAGYDWSEVDAGDWAGSDEVQLAEWDPVSARYIRLTMLSSGNGQPYASAAEVEVIVE